MIEATPLTEEDIAHLRMTQNYETCVISVPRALATIDADRKRIAELDAKIARKNARINELVTRLAEAVDVVKAAIVTAFAWDNWEAGGTYADDGYPDFVQAMSDLRDALAAYNRDSKDAGNG